MAPGLSDARGRFMNIPMKGKFVMPSDWHGMKSGTRVRTKKAGRRKGCRSKMVVLALTLLMVVGLASSASAGNGPADDGGWCGNRDSFALFGGSSGTGYLTEGYSHPLGHYTWTQDGWYANVTDRLAARYPGFTHKNYSKNGASAATFLPGGSQATAIDDLAYRQPDAAGIALGTNEYMSGAVPVAIFKANLTRLIQLIREASPRTSILLIKQWYVPHRTDADWAPFSEAITEVGREQGVTMIDIGAELPKLGYGTPDASGSYHDDKIHLSPAGNYTYGAAIWGALACWATAV